MVRSVPVPSSRVNCNSFLDFLTASHAFTFTALKSDLLKVSKSTISSNNGSTFTLEKSIFSTVFVSCAALFASFFAAPCDFIVGNSNTSRMAWLSVCALKRSRWSIGSFSSEYALHISHVLMKSSKRSTLFGSEGFFLVNGEISIGWSMINVGWISSFSQYSSKNRLMISPFLWRSSYSIWCSAASFLAASSSATSSKSIPAYFLIASFMVRRSNGFPRSISIPL